MVRAQPLRILDITEHPVDPQLDRPGLGLADPASHGERDRDRRDLEIAELPRRHIELPFPRALAIAAWPVLGPPATDLERGSEVERLAQVDLDTWIEHRRHEQGESTAELELGRTRSRADHGCEHVRRQRHHTAVRTAPATRSAAARPAAARPA